MMLGFALSGLQEFLYDLSPQNPSREQRTGEGGRERDAARRLRIRSAILTLIPGLVAWETIRHDPEAEILYLGGGKLLMSTSPEATANLEDSLHQLCRFLVLHSGGKLGACWANTSGNSDDADAIRDLLRALALAKWQAGRQNVSRGLAAAIHETAPAGCLGDRSWEADHGAEFARREDWAGFAVGAGGWDIGPWRAKPVKSRPDIALAGKAESNVTVSIPTCTPKQGEETVPLYELAEEDADGKPRHGAAYLGLLKLDGDGIGSLMAQALDEGADRYRQVSGALGAFFGPSLMDFLKKRFPRLYLVYSGGDDLVATGHYLEVVRAALEIQDRFAAAGLGCTASAGVSFYSRNSPILKAVEAAESELERAKETRNAISLGGCRLTWDDLRRTMTEVDALVEAVRHEHINRGALQLLRRLGEAWLDHAPAPTSELQFRSIPMLAYMRSRRAGWKETQWPPALKGLFDSLGSHDHDWPRAALVGTLAAWSTKMREEDT